MQEKNEIFADNALSILFNGALVPVSKTQPEQTQICKVIGYRLEAVKAENVRVAVRQPEDGRGIYRAMVYLNGVKRRVKNRNSSFFPRVWTKDKVIGAIFEAYQNKVVREISQSEYVGKASDGMNIVLWLDADGKVFDAMPLSDDPTQARRERKKAKRICKICGREKHFVCLEHNSYKTRKSFAARLAKKVRYFYRKLYFNLGKRLGLVD
jgi:hypothetical protein